MLTGYISGSFEVYDDKFAKHHFRCQEGDGAPGGRVGHPVGLAQDIHGTVEKWRMQYDTTKLKILVCVSGYDISGTLPGCFGEIILDDI
ncbi:hypothetical protein DPMN_137960 [Dreissena polymorpha]|uniref:Uncharacterized protein n=1 Tax=Dreissena polymorpha TaxID=45954 RepID=A0A9D4JJC2_DREPO|nr:hypothetical protein DPMN_137960 [Dreissena polymorpha]